MNELGEKKLNRINFTAAQLQPVPNNLTRDQLTGIKKLIPFKKYFKKEKHTTLIHLYKKTKSSDNTYYQKFIETFCGHHLADTDYAVIQSEMHHETSKAFISEASVEVILKYLTYIIWTDKFITGYFSAKVNDYTLYYLIDRLETHLVQWGIEVDH